MKKSQRIMEGEGIIIKTGGEYRFVMRIGRIGKIFQLFKGREVIKINEEAKNLTELQNKLRGAAKIMARELGISHVVNLNSETFY